MFRISDPHHFPHRLSFDDGLISFLPTDQSKLREASFLDGRSDFSTGPAVAVPLDDVLGHEIDAPPPDRYIFHISFCGSTLLSRLLDHPGKTMVVREPQCLSDLASRRAMLDQSGGDDDRVARMLPKLSALLGRRWQLGEPIIVKPSNWINNLTIALCSGPRPISPVFLTINARAFMLAVFRGGHDRIAYTARAAVHFSHAGIRNATRVAAALEGTDEMAKLARLAALAHRMQMEIFTDAALAGGWGEDHWIDFGDFQRDPVATVRQAMAALEVDIPDKIIARNLARWGAQHAKQPALAYSVEDQREDTEKAEAAFGRMIDEALEWTDAAFTSLPSAVRDSAASP
jgi:hypothetical protein